MNNKIKLSIISILIILNFIYFPFENKNLKYINFKNHQIKNNYNSEASLEVFLIPESLKPTFTNFSCISIDSSKLKDKNEETIIIFVEYLKQISKKIKSNQLIISIDEKSKYQKYKQFDWLITQILENKQSFNIKFIKSIE
ncbi:hypothetical protein RB653_004326 [Dictyostelium firmibasis]|uniref:Uncharacterized protein n=1 Tax=Dictyostelium firmibasis TaxID=79012 RepID=A0AAN7YXW5_9MYCE